MREKTLKRWKDVKFKWTLSRVNNNFRYFLRKDYKELKFDDPLDQAFCFFENDADCDGMGKVEEKFKIGLHLPETTIYLANTEREIKNLIPVVQIEMVELIKSNPKITDKLAIKEIENYTWEPFQYILIKK